MEIEIGEIHDRFVGAPEETSPIRTSRRRP